MNTLEILSLQYQKLPAQKRAKIGNALLYDDLEFVSQIFDEEIYEIVKKFPPEIRDIMAYCWTIETYIIHRHFITGRKVIRFTDNNIFRQLAATDALKMPAFDADLLLPFNTFYIDLSHGEFKIFSMLVEGVFFENLNDNYQIFCLLKPKSFIKTAHFVISKKHETLDDALKNMIKNRITQNQSFLENKIKNKTSLSIINENNLDPIHATSTNIVNIIFASLYYICAAMQNKERVIKNDEYTKAKKEASKAKNERKIAAKLANAYHYITLRQPIKEREEFIAGEAKLKSGFRLTLVRGHFRRQFYGSRTNPEHKIIWIKPYWKGEGNLDDKKHIYSI